jgi:hypothetical protein
VKVPSIAALLKEVAASSVPVSAIEYDGKRFRLEIAAGQPPAPTATAGTPAPPATNSTPFAKLKFVPGTGLIDDDSPLNPLDLVLTPPTIAPDAEAN